MAERELDVRLTAPQQVEAWPLPGIALIIASGILVARSSTVARAIVGRRRGRPV